MENRNKNSIPFDLLLKILLEEHTLKKTKECPEDEILIKYYLNLLPLPKKYKLDQHISQCEFCKTELNLIKQDEQIISSITQEEYNKNKEVAKKFVAIYRKKYVKPKLKLSVGKNLVEILKESFFFKPVYNLQEFIKSLQTLPEGAVGFSIPLQKYVIRQVELADTKIIIKLTADENQNLYIELLFTKQLNPLDGVTVQINKEQSYVSHNGKVELQLHTSGEYNIEVSLPDKTKFDFEIEVAKH
ncbi:MAG: hypothetical protein N2Z73_02215 [Endomicrobia bacterium]|nr:hypothetical protein [Endomicrobiia bacterium]